MNTIPLPASVVPVFVLNKDGTINPKESAKLFLAQSEQYATIRATGEATVKAALDAVYKDAGERPLQRRTLETLIASRMHISAQNAATVNEAIAEYLPGLIVSSREGSKPGSPEEVQAAQVKLATRLQKSADTRAKNAQPATV
jgi:hypothetical protein